MARFFRLIGVLTLSACAGRGVNMSAPVGAYPPRDLAGRRPLTRAEASGFTETSSYADVMVFIEALRQGNEDMYVTSLGKSPQGKDLPLIIMSRPLVKTP